MTLEIWHVLAIVEARCRNESVVPVITAEEVATIDVRDYTLWNSLVAIGAQCQRGWGMKRNDYTLWARL